eukprot:jgi/Chlat1/465/Chrsp103S00976
MESGNLPPPYVSGRRRESSPSAAATRTTEVRSGGAAGPRREYGDGTLRELAGGSIASTTAAVTGSWKLGDDDDDDDDHIALATLRSSFDRHSWRSSASSAPPSSSCSSPPASLQTRRDSFSFSSYASVNNEPLQLLTPPHTHYAQSSSHLARKGRRNSDEQASPASSQQRSGVELKPAPPPPPLRCADQQHSRSNDAEGIAPPSVAEPSAAAFRSIAGEWSAPPALSLIFQQQQQLMLLQQQVQLLQQSYQMPQHQPPVLPPPPKPQMVSIGVNTSFPWPATVPAASDHVQHTCMSSTTTTARITSKSFVDSSSQTSDDVEAHPPHTRFQQLSIRAAEPTHSERSVSVASSSPRSMISSGRFSSSSSSSSGGGSVLQEATYKQLHLRSWHDTLADYQLQRLSLEPALKPAATTLPPLQESRQLPHKARADVPRIVYVPISDSSSDSDDEDIRLRDKYLRGTGWSTGVAVCTDIPVANGIRPTPTMAAR